MRGSHHIVAALSTLSVLVAASMTQSTILSHISLKSSHTRLSSVDEMLGSVIYGDPFLCGDLSDWAQHVTNTADECSQAINAVSVSVVG